MLLKTMELNGSKIKPDNFEILNSRSESIGRLDCYNRGWISLKTMRVVHARMVFAVIRISQAFKHLLTKIKKENSNDNHWTALRYTQ